MNYTIVKETPKDLRALARHTLKNQWFNVFKGFFLFEILSSILPMILSEVLPFGKFSTYNEVLDATIQGSYIEELYTAVLSGAFLCGLCSYLLAFFRRRDLNPLYIFNGFEYFFKTLLITIVIGVFTLVWSMLFVIPGIIAALSYSQALYILADDPSKGVMQCIRESKTMMRGNKMLLFITLFSFFGWIIISMIPTAFLPVIAGVPGILISLLGAIPYLFVAEYMSVTETAFFEIASGRLVQKPAEVQPELTAGFIENTNENRNSEMDNNDRTE